MVLMSVDLPHPLGPRMATCSPTPMRRLTSRSTIFSPRITQTRSSSMSGRWSDGTGEQLLQLDRKSTRLNSSHLVISYAVFCLKKNQKLTDKRILVGLGGHGDQPAGLARGL